MLNKDNNFDEFTLPDKISKIDISTSLGQCLETNQRASVHVWRKF
jgi:hypothetical protein